MPSGYSAQQVQNAQIIEQVGQSVGASQRDIQIALMTALQESGLQNLNYGDRDSLGLFQQRGAWGSAADRTDPATAARMFFLGGQQGQRGLLSISDRNSLSLTQAAQAVQQSAFPDAYAKWEYEASSLLGIPKGSQAVSAPADTPVASGDTSVAPATTQVDALGAVTADKAGIGALSMDEIGAQADALQPFGSNSPTGATSPSTNHTDAYRLPTLDEMGLTSTGQPLSKYTGQNVWRQRVVENAMKMLGTPYQWGGTTPGLGLDCSGLVQNAFQQAGMSMPRLSWDQAAKGQRVALNQLQPGDLVAWHNDNQNPDLQAATHIAIYIGNGQIIEAPRPGRNVQISNLYDTQQAWGVAMGGNP